MAKDLWPQKTHLDILTEKVWTMNFIKSFFCFVALMVFLLLFSVFVWPTQWKILPVKTIREEQFQQRQNRFTDEVETWIPCETQKIGGRMVGDRTGTWTKEY